MSYSKSDPEAVLEDCPYATGCSVRIAGECNSKFLVTDDAIHFFIEGYVPLQPAPMPLIPEPDFVIN